MNIKMLVISLLVITAMSLFCYYLSPKGRKPPSVLQKITASIWVFTRRLICLVGAIFFALAAILLLTNAPSSVTPIKGVIYGLICFATSIWVIFFGFYGKKSKHSSPREDIALHEAQKKYYKSK